MLSCFNPKHLAMAGLLLAATAAPGATAPAATGNPEAGTAASAPAPAASSAGATLTVSRVTFISLQDPYAKANWMLAEVDFTGQASKSVIINDVSVTLSLGWTNPGATPPVDVPLSSTLKLIGVFTGKPNAVLFFVPPETLARASRGQPYDASRAPDFYAVEFKIGEAAQPMSQASYSPKLTAATAKSFSTLAETNGLKGLLYTQANVPFSILPLALQRVSSSTLPTPVAPSSL